MATEVALHDMKGKKVGDASLPSAVFEAEVSVPLMHQVVVAGMAALRRGTHSTKTRGEVRGGGKKPWRQKGTGRARHGSIRSPIWSGGGIAHGPKPRDHDVRVNKKMRRNAIRAALSDAAATGKLVLVKELAFSEPRTKDAVAVLDALELAGRVLIVIAAPDENTEKSFRNLRNVRIGYAGGISTYEVLVADKLLITQDAVDGLEKRITDKRKAA